MHTLVVMNVFVVSVILALGLSADALACGFCAGASRLKIPLVSAIAAATVSALCVAVGMGAGGKVAPLLPESAGRYISFAALGIFGLIKIGSRANVREVFDCNCDRYLSVGEGLALGAALSVDGLAAGFGYAAGVYMLVCTVAATFVFSAAALFFGAKGGAGSRGGRAGNITAGLALVILAVQKLIFG